MTGTLTLEDLARTDVESVIVAGVDMQGRLFGKRMPTRRFLSTLEEGLHVCTCVYSWDLPQTFWLKVEFAGAHTGWQDFRLRPDLSTLSQAGWLDATAICLADAVDEATDEDLRIAPRTILRSAIQALADNDMAASAATELEFFLYRGEPAQLRDSGYRNLAATTLTHADYNIFEGDLMEPFFAAVRRALDATGIPVEVSQVEYGYGQWEINLEYSNAIEMADRHALFKHVVRTVAARHGYTATFMPRPQSDDLGSSCHMHLSIAGADGRPLFHEPDAPRGVSAVLRHAIGGVLAHAPELFPFYAPTINSYRRTNSQDFAGNGLTWGFDNRTTTVRVLTGTPQATRLEFRLAGADVNPYLALAGMLASAGEGVSNAVDPGPPFDGDAYAAGPEAAVFPTTLAEAADRFLASQFAASAFGDQVVRHYHAVARYEWEQFQHAVTDWERERYLESI